MKDVTGTNCDFVSYLRQNKKMIEYLNINQHACISTAPLASFKKNKLGVSGLTLGLIIDANGTKVVLFL